MILFPAIDIYNGKSVRLYRGKFNRVTEYGDPLEMAQKWETQGAEYLHVVDLNGAEQGKEGNLSVIRALVTCVNIPVQMGGGIRTLDDIEQRLSAGIRRVILGTVCYRRPEFMTEAVKAFGAEHIICSIDAADGFVAVNGWSDKTEISAHEMGVRVKDSGIDTVVYTDISRDGALTGVNTKACVEMSRRTGLNVIASGGVSALTDLTGLATENIYGAILGKAIYEKNFTVTEAIAALKGEVYGH